MNPAAVCSSDKIPTGKVDEYQKQWSEKYVWKKKIEAAPWFEHGISCLLDRRFNQLSHAALADKNA